MGVSPREIYHTLQPHPALSPVPTEFDLLSIRDQAANEAAWRQLLFEGVLGHLLPPEDLENPCLRVLVNEIFAEMIMGNGVGKACEGWLIWDGIAKALTAVHDNSHIIVEKLESPTASRLEQFGLLPSQDANPQTSMPANSANGIAQTISILLWELLRIAFLIFVSLRTAVTVFTESASLPPRSTEEHVLFPTTIASMDDSYASITSTPSRSSVKAHPKRPILKMSAWSVPRRLLHLHDRMPWLSSTVSLIQHYLIYGPGNMCSTDGRIDR